MAELSRLSDDELLARTRDQPEAFGVFYERHAAFVAAFLRRATGSTETALDLTAESFAAALAASHRYRAGEAPARAWLLGIARNKLLASQRSRGRERAARCRLGIPLLESSDEALERVEELLDASSSGYADGMAELSPEEREAVAARVIEEREYAEIAATTGVTQPAVRQRVSRGLARLAKLGSREG